MCTGTAMYADGAGDDCCCCCCGTRRLSCVLGT